MELSPSSKSAPGTYTLNPARCEVRHAEGKGRGVYGARSFIFRFTDVQHWRSVATQALPAQTLLESSPVLLFSAQEYEEHGKYTLLDHYTFRWRDGRMALALGLGASSLASTGCKHRRLIQRTSTRIVIQSLTQTKCKL